MQTAYDYSAQHLRFLGSRVITQACFDQISFHPKWVDYRRRFLLSFRSFIVRATGIADEDRRPTVTHELNLIRD